MIIFIKDREMVLVALDYRMKNPTKKYIDYSNVCADFCITW